MYNLPLTKQETNILINTLNLAQHYIKHYEENQSAIDYYKNMQNKLLKFKEEQKLQKTGD